MTDSNSYHHGNLRRALLDSALAAISEKGPSAISLRFVAKSAGVSHAAPAHHFGDKAGLLTALATEGYHKFASELEKTWAATHSFAELGVAYVRFAINNQTYFSLMFRLELLRATDSELKSARLRSRTALNLGASSASTGDPETAAIAGWSLVHGYAMLYLSGSLPPEATANPEETARTLTSKLQP